LVPGSGTEPPQDLGIGVYNKNSTYALRILFDGRDPSYVRSLDGDKDDDDDEDELMGRILSSTLSRCVSTRHALGLPSHDTTCYRLSNGDGDLLSGLSVDVYGPKAVVMVQAGWGIRWRKEIERAIKEEGEGVEEVIFRYGWDRLRQDGEDVEAVKEGVREEGGMDR